MQTGIAPAEALRIVLEMAPVLGPEIVASRAALGRVLAEPVVSTRCLPPADNAAMDGYAVRAADLAGASAASPIELEVVSEAAAGAAAERPVGPGEASRIFTGAPIPAGADAVVRQEDSERRGDRVWISVEPLLREHLRDAGEDVREGEEVISAGAVLGPAHLGMLASLGRSVVAVHQRPRVAILSGGDELVEPDADVAGGRIVSSNSYSVAAQCLELGAEPVYLGIARDSPRDLERRFRAGLRADVLVSSAGVSVGDRDFVRAVLEKLGCTWAFWGVQIKPGYPLAFGRFAEASGPLVFGLPGNPVSAMVTFEEFARPALLKMTGHASWFRPLVEAKLDERLEKRAGRLHFVRVQLERRAGDIVARPTGSPSSGALRSMTQCQGLLIFPAEATELRPGDTASVQVLDAAFLASPHSGF